MDAPEVVIFDEDPTCWCSAIRVASTIPANDKRQLCAGRLEPIRPELLVS